MPALLKALGDWRPFRAVVVGDFMLDQLVFGNADRLSPEAPVPVLHVQRTEDRPGGAASVSLDLAALKASVKALGVIGSDAEGAALKAALAAAGIDPAGLVVDTTRPTTVKRSLIGLAQHRHPQKMFRVDHESREPLAARLVDELLAVFERLLAAGKPDAVCIEDYNKGVCTEALCQGIIRRCRAAGVPVLIDPAAIEDYTKYRGATAITPNRTEAALAVGAKAAAESTPGEHVELARRLRADLDLDAVVITLDRHGALLLERDGQPTPVPTVARQVYDVSGAGDMVLAALAGARAQGLGWLDAVRLANYAAGLEVEVFGVAPIPIERIHREVLSRQRHGLSHSKLRTLEELCVEVAALRTPHNGEEQPTVVFTNGCFDMLHAGHLSLLQRAAALGGEEAFLIVAINADETVKRLKGSGRPVFLEADRAALLSGLECVGAVLVFAEETPERVIRAIRPDVLAKGAEYSIDQVPGARFVLSCGGRVELLEMVPGQSTTGTVERMRGA